MSTERDILIFDNSFAREMSGFYVAWQPERVAAGRLLFFNVALAEELGLEVAGLDEATLAAWFGGGRVMPGAEPLSQVYAGHQFGHFSPQLGDGRALLLGEVIDRTGRRRDIAFKGSGPTPFARGGDGKAAVGPMLREVLIGEGMQALGIPTTRALAVVGTGERVRRETPLPGAVLTRVAASHLRVGTFEYFAARGESGRVRQLADYAIARHDPEWVGQPDRFVRFLRAVAQRQAALVAKWMHVGFIHGVMNTDNMAVSGETIDYGPCAFLEAYAPATVFSSIDHQGRYAYANQPAIARWNLARFAETLLPLLDVDPDRAFGLANEVIEAFPEWFRQQQWQGWRAKLGLSPVSGLEAQDARLAEEWLALMEADRVDFTWGWHALTRAVIGDVQPLRALFVRRAALEAWLERWRERGLIDVHQSGRDPATIGEARSKAMRAVNPWLIPRNHRVEEALTAASRDGDMGPFERLLEAVRHPFDANDRWLDEAAPAPAAVTARYRTFCGT